MYALTLHAYCGMAIPIEAGDRADVRREAAILLRRRRRSGHPITVVRHGAEWEIGEPDGAGMVPDTAGLLSIEAIGAICSECGQQTDTDARRLSPSARRYFICADCNNPDRFDDRDDIDGPWSGGFADNH